MALKMAACHPDKEIYQCGLCSHCYYERRVGRSVKAKQQMGLLQLGDGPPRRIPDVEQRALTDMPISCRKCFQAGGLSRRGREVHCHLCGSTWFLVAA